MKILATALIVVFAFSIIFVSSHDAFALGKPQSASISFSKTVDKPLVLSPTLVTYTYTVINTGDVFCQVRNTFPATGLIDDKLGVIPTTNTIILPGQTRTYTASTTITADTTNTATFTCRTDAGTLVTAKSSATVNVFQPSVEVTKTGPTLSKVGDDVKYDFTIKNTGSSDSPNIIKNSITDTLLGDITATAPAACTSLAPGASCSFSVTRTVLAGDPDPLDNTVTVHYHPDGFTNDLTDSDDHSVNLFQPSVEVTKDGPATANVGDIVTYDFIIKNTGSSDSPNLQYDSASDTLIGPLDAVALPDCDVLAPGASCSFSATRTVLAGDPNPLVNTVTVHYHPDGFTNDITDSDDHSVQIIKTASIKVVKMADPSLIEVGETVTYTADVTNTSPFTVTLCNGVDDNGTPFDFTDDIDVDALMGGPFSLASGESKTFTYQKDIFVDTKNTVQFFCIGPDNNPVTDSATAQVTVLVVGGNYMPIDSTALLLAGIQSSAAWLVTVMAGLAGIGIYLVRFRVREN